MDRIIRFLKWLARTCIQEVVGRWAVLLAGSVGVAVTSWFESLSWGSIGETVLFAFVVFWFYVAVDRALQSYRTWRKRQQETATPDLETLERQRKAEERQKNLRRYWEADPKNGRKAARLMLVVDREHAEDIYREFAPLDDAPEISEEHSEKLYSWAVSYAWAYHLTIAGESDQADHILGEAEYSAGFWDKSYRCEDSENDKQIFYVEPLEKSGYQIEENDE